MLLSTENGFRIQGPVSFDNVVSLRHAGEKYFSTTLQNHITVNLSEMKECDASCFSLLLSWMRLAKKKNCTLTVTQAPPSIQRMAKMFGVIWVVCDVTR